jgi:hypothetical protein
VRRPLVVVTRNNSGTKVSDLFPVTRSVLELVTRHNRFVTTNKKWQMRNGHHSHNQRGRKLRETHRDIVGAHRGYGL